MFYPVRVFNKRGQFKKEIPPKTLSQSYWSKIFDPERKNIQITAPGLSKKDREKLGWELDAFNFSED
jgi:hypothetical protein